MAILGVDQLTVTDLTDGYTVDISPGSHAWPATATAANAGSLEIVVTALQGDEVVNCSVVNSEITSPSGVSTTVNSSDPTSPKVTVSVTTSVNAPGIVVIPVHVGDVTIVKRFSYSLARTGAGGSPGVHATNVVVGSEAVTIPCLANGKTAAAGEVIIPFAGYIGANRAAATLTAPTLPSGMSSTANTAATTSADGSIKITWTSGANFGGDAIRTGQFELSFACNGQTHKKKYSWSKAVAGEAGADGDDGADGADAIILAVVSSNGTIFKNTGVSTTLTCHVFRGGEALTNAQVTALGTIRWYKDGGGTSVGSGPTLVVGAGQVTNVATYEARLES